jgi:hypothetical protein
MTQPERASIHVVTPGQEAAAAPPPAGPSSMEPEAQPPITTPPVEDVPPDLGGDVSGVSPTADERVAAIGGSLADRLRARYEGMAATEEFGVPGWELPNGEDGLIIEVRAFGDRKGWGDGISNEVFIAKSTHALWYVDDDGTRTKIEGGWGPELAKMIGVNVTKAADLVSLVISKPDPNDRSRRISNVAGIGSLAAEIVGWSRKSYREAEDNLGE